MRLDCFVITVWYFMEIFISRAYIASVKKTDYQYTIFIAANFQEEFQCNSDADKATLTQMKKILSESKGCKLYVGNILNTEYGNTNITHRITKAIQILRYLELDFIMFGVNDVRYGDSVITKLMETFRKNIPFSNLKYSSSNLSPREQCPAVIGYAESMDDKTADTNITVSNLEQLAASYKQKKLAVIAIGCQRMTSAEAIVKETSSIIVSINGCDGRELEAINLTNSRRQPVLAVYPQSSKQFLTKIFIHIKYTGEDFVLQYYNASKVAVGYADKTSLEHVSNQMQSVPLSISTKANYTIIGKTMVFLNGQCYRSECNFGSLIADAFVQHRYNKYKGADWTDTAIALVAAGTIFASINATAKNNSIYFTDINYAISDDKLVTLELSGMDIRRSLNYGFDVIFKHGEAKFLQVSGLRIVYDPLKQSIQKLISVKVRTTVGVPMYTLLMRSQKYNVIMTKALANGNYGHRYFKEHGKVVREENITVIEAVCRYISELKSIFHSNEDRILEQASLSSTAVKVRTLHRGSKIIFFVIVTFSPTYQLLKIVSA